MFVVVKCATMNVGQLHRLLLRLPVVRQRAVSSLNLQSLHPSSPFLSSRLISSSPSFGVPSKSSSAKADKVGRASEGRSVTEDLLNDMYSKRSKKVAVTRMEKVGQMGADMTYIFIGITGVGALLALLYAVGSEYVMPNSPQSIMNKSLKLIEQRDEIRDFFGSPLKAYTSENRRRRRRQPAHVQYSKDGEERMRMVFFIKGSMASGAVHYEVIMNPEGQGGYDYRYLFAESNDNPPRVFVVLDERERQKQAAEQRINQLPIASL